MMETNFESHDGIIDGDSEIPKLGRYIDFGGFWFEDFVLTIDHIVYEETWEDQPPDVRVYINGMEAEEFIWHIESGSETDGSTGINPKNKVHRKP